MKCTGAATAAVVGLLLRTVLAEHSHVPVPSDLVRALAPEPLSSASSSVTSSGLPTETVTIFARQEAVLPGNSTTTAASASTTQDSSSVETSEAISSAAAASQTDSEQPASSTATEVVSSPTTAAESDSGSFQGSAAAGSSTPQEEPTETDASDSASASASASATEEPPTSSFTDVQTTSLVSTDVSVGTVQTTNAEGQTTAFPTTVQVTHTLVVVQTASAAANDPSSRESSSVSPTSAASTTVPGADTTVTASGGSLATATPSSEPSQGLSSKDRSIVIGVAVGVGGFLLVAGVAFACWKLKRGGSGSSSRVSHHSGGGAFSDDDGSSSTSLGGKKRRSMDSDMFRANIDQYHAPAARPNTAANF